MKAFPNEFENAGMDLRDYFAAKAMQVFLSAWIENGSQVHFSEIISKSYVTADAMIEERKK